MTMYLMQLQSHPKQFKEIMNNHLKQKKIEGQVISSKENKVKLLDAQNCQNTRKKILEKYTFRKDSAPQHHSVTNLTSN